jgi:hypothetical protein
MDESLLTNNEKNELNKMRAKYVFTVYGLPENFWQILHFMWLKNRPLNLKNYSKK